jgi:hypothetical protein
VHYHDREWGFPVDSDQRLFEKLCLEGFQSGLSWLTILNKRENFRAALRVSISIAWRSSARPMCSACCRTQASCATAARSKP